MSDAPGIIWLGRSAPEDEFDWDTNPHATWAEHQYLRASPELLAMIEAARAFRLSAEFPASSDQKTAGRDLRAAAIVYAVSIAP